MCQLHSLAGTHENVVVMAQSQEKSQEGEQAGARVSFLVVYADLLMEIKGGDVRNSIWGYARLKQQDYFQMDLCAYWVESNIERHRVGCSALTLACCGRMRIVNNLVGNETLVFEQDCRDGAAVVCDRHP